MKIVDLSLRHFNVSGKANLILAVKDPGIKYFRVFIKVEKCGDSSKMPKFFFPKSSILKSKLELSSEAMACL